MKNVIAVLRPLGRHGTEWLKANTIGAVRWEAIINGEAPATRTVNASGWAGMAPATENMVERPYLTRAELSDIIALARAHGMTVDPERERLALAELLA